MDPEKQAGTEAHFLREIIIELQRPRAFILIAM